MPGQGRNQVLTAQGTACLGREWKAHFLSGWILPVSPRGSHALQGSQGAGGI